MHEQQLHSQTRPKVVYVMGAGRSGSTILGVALGNCPGVFYAGELDAWFGKKGIPNFGGEERERFWSGIRERMDGAVDLHGSLPRRYIEHSSALFRARPWRRQRELRRRYRAVVEELYAQVAFATGCTHIVDTSHYPLRARELQAIDGIDLYLIFLVRSPETVVASFGREDVDQPSKAPLAANVYLYMTQLLSTLVFLRQPRERRILLQYENFLGDPQGVLASLQEWLGLSAEHIDLSALDTGVPFQGNRLLRSPQVEFRAQPSNGKRRDWPTYLAQSPWTLVLSFLRPTPEPASNATQGAVAALSEEKQAT